MINEKGFVAYHALGNVADDMMMDALLPEDGSSASTVHSAKRRTVYEFFSRGWGVAIICAVVAVAVMGGIIWAGNRPGGVTPPVGMTVSPETEHMIFPTETQEGESGTELSDTQDPERNAVVLHSLQRKYVPPKFLCYSTTLTEGEDGLSHGETADGLGFEGVMQQGETPALPTVTWAKDAELADFLDVAEGYIVKEFMVYDMDMQLVESGSSVMGYDSEESVKRFVIKKLPVGTWYMSLRVEHDGGEMHQCVYDYAFIAKVAETVTDTCTVRTDQDRYAWGVEDKYYHITLTSTVKGAILDIYGGSWELVNLDTGKHINTLCLTASAPTEGTFMVMPSSQEALAYYTLTWDFDWETTPPGRYRLVYTSVTMEANSFIQWQDGHPYYDFVIYDPKTGEPAPTAPAEGQIFVSVGGEKILPCRWAYGGEKWSSDGFRINWDGFVVPEAEFPLISTRIPCVNYAPDLTIHSSKDLTVTVYDENWNLCGTLRKDQLHELTFFGKNAYYLSFEAEERYENKKDYCQLFVYVQMK